jgi:hypothetical protein
MHAGFGPGSEDFYSSFHPQIHQSRRIWRDFGSSLNSNHISGFLRQICEISILWFGN